MRYGFEFADRGHLFGQLDGFLFKVFNRRAFLRVLPALGSKLRMDLRVSAGDLEIDVNDLSARGVGFVLTDTDLPHVMASEEFEAVLRLPNKIGEVQLRLKTRHMTRVEKGTLIGTEVLIDGPKSPAATKLLEEYVDARARDMAQWDAAVGRS